MGQGLIIDIAREALYTVILLAMPMLGLALLVGLVISIFQATTQIQEPTLTFIPKILAVIFAIIVFGPWMLNVLMDFTYRIFNNINGFIF